ncbi:MAG TPA: GNAT family N-acetyltransferase [Anseongella sp.]|nr:GNAT family N-acetyltransferase [Anseongella sp.]
MKVEHDLKYQQFTVYLEDDEAELAYAKPEAGVISFTHTFVPEAYRGWGIAEKLISEGLRYAGENQLKVIAGCEAVSAYLDRHPEFKKLLR